MQRLTITCCLIVGVFILPWWATLLLSVYGALRFPLFFEALIAGVSIDVMYGTHELFGVSGAATMFALIIILCSLFIRRHIRYESLSS